MKRFLTILLLAFMVSCPSFAVVVEQMGTSTIPEKIGSGTPLWVTFSGSSGGSATSPMVLPFTTYNAAIASNTAVPLGSIASFTAGNYVTIRTNAKVFWAGQGSTSTASAVLGDYVDSGEQIGFTVASSTAGSWGSSYFYCTSNASVSVRVWPTSR